MAKFYRKRLRNIVLTPEVTKFYDEKHLELYVNMDIKSDKKGLTQTEVVNIIFAENAAFQEEFGVSPIDYVIRQKMKNQPNEPELNPDFEAETLTETQEPAQ